MGLTDNRARPLLGGALAALLLTGALPGTALAQQSLRAPSGTELEVPRDTLLRMMEETRAYYDTLVRDPDVLYYTGYARAVTDTSFERALPWRAVEVRSDSVARVATPGNLREGDRAYHAYAVARMRALRSGEAGAPTCAEAMSREVEVLEAFARGWTVSRIYYGAPPYPPLDELAFLHREGMLAPYLAVHAPRWLGDCARTWREEHPESVESYRTWRRRVFEAGGRGVETGGDSPEAGGDSVEAGGSGDVPDRTP